ncbi:ADP-ribosylglycohydrolase family protein [Microlunatus speluncae]|uniref:ADP-ribosylglycohydrolase family protein n=1 Tax=Microlunatus speluncae TaxID=2594267 RepID=UPI0012663C74|nr:ADP-ribosylglycohydrolase family protein [Microlunatus speluncae]
MNERMRDRIRAVVAGQAVGDALGGATEGWTPDQIQQRHGGPVDGVVGPYYADWRTARPIAPYHKGDGHITDDTLMTHALIEVYARRRDHLDAYAMATDLVPLLINEPTWIPELEGSALLLQRLFLAEKWIVTRLHYGHVDPREAGVGNIVNCGAAMYVGPVGLVNAGQPEAAYAEAIDLTGAHQSSYGREAAGVFAAAVAAALLPDATADSVVEAAIGVAKDGTRDAIIAVARAARELPAGSADDQIRGTLREAIRPYDTVGDDYRAPLPDARRPSRTKSIEELPVALGFCLTAGGDFRTAVLGAVNYGRDADSIATMAGAVCAGLGGTETIPADWIEAIEAASKIDLGRVADRLIESMIVIMEDDRARLRRRSELLDRMLDGER